ncbi:hypothetical protein AVDCRST_MAG84-2537 [uncultured Microcoleus sp.]|uniref:Uncharacterized protein n=1 Tax=uncultured Microcoleus sp. TaxID=259945 RepID=A0A6J4LY52_9CYAN|nr:hypothetical protein AVDCRST_MAG84-2537 [uncultured Microcoleus sp.]
MLQKGMYGKPKNAQPLVWGLMVALVTIFSRLTSPLAKFYTALKRKFLL